MQLLDSISPCMVNVDSFVDRREAVCIFLEFNSTMINIAAFNSFSFVLMQILHSLQLQNLHVDHVFANFILDSSQPQDYDHILH